MHIRFPLLLWPLFQLQDQMQLRSLTRREWTVISRRDAKMRAANRQTLRTKDALVAGGAAGLARIEEMEVEDVEEVSARRGGGGSSAPDPGAQPRAMAPGQRLAAGGDMTGVAMRSGSKPKARPKGGGKRAGKGKGGRR